MSKEPITLAVNPYTYPGTDTYQNWLMALHQDWDRFKEIAGSCVSHSTFHAANQTLGYNLAKATPLLILELERRELYYARLAHDMREVSQELASERKMIVALNNTIENLRATPDEGNWWED